jgi:hypothetical protein
VRALARFELAARVLSAERYRFDREAKLSPIDLALGWGPMSSNAVLDTLDISQGGRFFHWSSREPMIAPGEIMRHSANMHMVPVDEATRATLLEARGGSLVFLSGWLVEAKADGWKWRSSPRAASGAGACELVLVERPPPVGLSLRALMALLHLRLDPPAVLGIGVGSARSSSDDLRVRDLCEAAGDVGQPRRAPRSSPVERPAARSRRLRRGGSAHGCPSCPGSRAPRRAARRSVAGHRTSWARSSCARPHCHRSASLRRVRSGWRRPRRRAAR